MGAESGKSCDAAFRLDAVETLEEINARDDAGAELAKMNLDSRLVTAPSGFCQTPRIALSKRACFNEAFKDQITGRANGCRRRAPRGEISLTGFVVCGIRSTATCQACSILKVGFRVAARAGLHRFMGHRSDSASQNLAERIGGDQPASSN